MTVRTFAISALLAAAVPLSAQEPSPGGADPLRTQIMTFEDALRRAIEIAGEDLSTQVQQQLKTPVPIQFGFIPAIPVVRGWPLVLPRTVSEQMPPGEIPARASAPSTRSAARADVVLR